MKEVSRATIGRIPRYLQYLKNAPAHTATISATTLAHALGLGEVQVRKDLSAVSGAGRPKIGYQVDSLIGALESFLAGNPSSGIVIVGAGKLGRALLDYSGFQAYGLEIAAAFDTAVTTPETSNSGKPIYAMAELEPYCQTHPVQIGILTVPATAAQTVADRLIACGVQAIWCFAPCVLRVPDGISVQYENMALSLAYLNQKIGRS